MMFCNWKKMYLDLKEKNEKLHLKVGELSRESALHSTEALNLRLEIKDKDYKYKKLQAELDAAMLNISTLSATYDDAGCAKGVWCGACDNGKAIKVRDLLGRVVGCKTVCTFGKCDNFTSKSKDD